MACFELASATTESTASSSGGSPRSCSTPLERARLRRLLQQPESGRCGLVEMMVAKRMTAAKLRADHSMLSTLNVDATSFGSAAPRKFQLPLVPFPAKCIDLDGQQRWLREPGSRPRPVLSDPAPVDSMDKIKPETLENCEAPQSDPATPVQDFAEARAFLLRFRAVVAAEARESSDRDLPTAAPSSEVPADQAHHKLCGPPPPELRGLSTRHTPQMQMTMACQARSQGPVTAAVESADQGPATQQFSTGHGAADSSRFSASEAPAGMSAGQGNVASATPKILGPPPGTFFSRQASAPKPAPPMVASPFARQLSLPAPSPNAFSTASMGRQMSLPSSPQEEMKRTAKGLLNKICPETVDCIAEKIAAVQVSSPEDLEVVIDLIFAKALAEPHYCETYADLVFKLKAVFPEFPSQAGGRPITFKSVVLNLCQHEFEGFLSGLDADQEMPEADEEEAAFQRKNKKDRVLANMKLTGHLFLRALLPAKVIGSVVRELLLCQAGETDHGATPGEHAVECACELLMATGYTLEGTPGGKQALVQVCGRLLDLQTAKTPSGKRVLSKRVQFVVQDLLDTRAAGWTKKVHKTRPKTMSEIRLDQTKDLQNRSCENTPGAEHVIAGQRPAYLSMPAGI